MPQVLTHGRVRGERHDRPSHRPTDPGAEPELKDVEDVARGFGDCTVYTELVEVPPRDVLCAADRAPDEWHLESPQVAGLTVSAERHLVRQIELEVSVEPARDADGSPLPEVIGEIEDSSPKGALSAASTQTCRIPPPTASTSGLATRRCVT